MARSKTEYLVGRQIRAAANNAGMTLRTLGEKLGVSKPTIYAYTTGALHVPDSRLKEIAELTGHSLEFFSTTEAQSDLDIGEQLKLIDATLSPPDPRTASRLALAVIERESESEDPLTLAKLSFRAGNALLQHGDYFDAIQQLEHSRRAFLNLGHIEFAANAAQSLGFCYINLGRLDKAKDSFVYSRDHLPPDSKWMGAIALAALAERLGEFDTASLELQKLLHSKKVNGSALAYIYANLASLHCNRTEWQSARASIDQALELAFSNNVSEQCVEMLVRRSQVASREGAFEEASESLIRAHDIAFGLDDAARKALVEAAWSEMLLFAGKVDLAREYAVRALSMATRGGFVKTEGIVLRILAEIAFDRCDYQQARDYAIQAVSHSESHQYPVQCAISTILLARAHLALGDLQLAYGYLDEADKAAELLQLPEVALLARCARAIGNSEKLGLSEVKSLSAECSRRKLNILRIRLINEIGKTIPSLATVDHSLSEGFRNGDASLYLLNEGAKERIILSKADR